MRPLVVLLLGFISGFVTKSYLGIEVEQAAILSQRENTKRLSLKRRKKEVAPLYKFGYRGGTDRRRYARGSSGAAWRENEGNRPMPD